MSDIKITSHCSFEGLCNQYCPPYNNRDIPCNGKNKNTEKNCQYDTRCEHLTERSACPFTEGCEDDDCCWPCDKWFLWHDNQMREEGAKAERDRFNAFLDFVIHTGELQYHSTFGCYDIHEQFKDIFDKAKSLRSPGYKQDNK